MSTLLGGLRMTSADGVPAGPPGPPGMPDPSRLTATGAAELVARTERLLGFTRLFWTVVEPERALVEGWNVGCVAEHLEEVADPGGSIRNLIVNVPPRAMKSLLTCVFWFAWVWARRPATRWMYSSFAGDLVRRDSMRCRSVVAHPLYRRLWGIGIKDDQNTQLRFTNQHEGFRYGVTVSGQGMGEGADFLVCDDPINPKKARSPVERAACVYWWRTTMARRVTDERTARRVIIMQRLHEADLTGYLVAEQTGWDHLVLPMRYEPRRYVFLSAPAGAGPEGSDGAQEVPAGSPGLTAADPPAADPLSADALLRDLKAAVAALDAQPRDAIRPTALQRRRPDLVDGPGGSGRSEPGDLLWPERFPAAVVQKAEAELGPDAAGQYQQRPSAEAGDVFRRETFRRFEPLWEVEEDQETGAQQTVFAGVRLFGPEDGQQRVIRAPALTFFQTVDTALTEGTRSAFTAVATCFATPEFDLGIWHVFRARLEVQYQFGALTALRGGPARWNPKSRVITPGPAWPFVVRFQAVERKASGYGLIQQGAAAGTPFHPLQVEGDKVQRAVPVATLYVNGKVYHPAPARPWVVELEDELATFPNGSYADQADVVAYAGYLLTHDKILRATVNRPLAESLAPDPNTGPDGKPLPPAGNALELNAGGGTVTINFPDDDTFGGFGAGWR